jgi:hypothetical protein
MNETNIHTHKSLYVYVVVVFKVVLLGRTTRKYARDFCLRAPPTKIRGERTNEQQQKKLLLL